MGCANYHAWIDFDDGNKWLVRIPKSAFSDIPTDLIEYFVASEYATLKFLETTKVPAPKAFGYGLASDRTNHVGVSFLFMEVLHGRPYYSHMAMDDQKNHIINQLADILIEISTHPFPKAGSLVIRDGNIDVSQTASNRFPKLDRYGPFNNDFDYFTAIAEQHLDLIADGQLFHMYALEAFFFYRLLKDHVTNLTEATHIKSFFLSHVGDKGDHLLIDENYNIVGVID
ncbi:hypothetical protein N0V90_002334 [Kalmusia sp. IMI 367209]|nr:hypothetical protein N0V90_002334 [Kalmusia sp. IMI 367209]